MPETLAYTYTTQCEIDRIMSIPSREDYSEDDEDSLTTLPSEVVNDAIVQATDEINVYCLRYYTESSLANNSYVRRIATWIACHLLTQRKGEQARYEGQYNKAIEWLTKVHDGAMQIPRIAQRSDLVPCHSNYVIDERFSKAKIRVQQETSTGQAYSGQNGDITFGSLW